MDDHEFLKDLIDSCESNETDEELIFVTDPQIAQRWDMDDLTKDEHDALMFELLSSRRAKEVFKQNLLELGIVPTAAQSDIETKPIIAPKPSEKSNSKWVAILAIAASLLAILLVLPLATSEVNRQLAQAENAIAVGDLDEALNIINNVAQTELSDKNRSRAEELTNQAVQLIREENARVSLSDNRHLIDGYGFGLDGFGANKTVDRNPHFEDVMLRSLERFPDSKLLRLNYADYLLRLSGREQIDEAKTILNGLIDDPEFGTPAKLAAGIAELQSISFAVNDRDREQILQQALAWFVQVRQESPNEVGALLNSAICLEALQRQSEANVIWQQIKARDIDDDLRRRIDKHLQEQQ